MAQQDQQCLGSARMRVQCLAQWVKDPAMLQLQLGSDPWPGNSICPGAAKNEKKKKSALCHSFYQTSVGNIGLKAYGQNQG